MLGLYLAISIFSLTILIPVYYYGTDQSFNTAYLTFWSRISIPHLGLNSIMNVVPILAIVVISGCTMFFYHQFTLVYIFFR